MVVALYGIPGMRCGCHLGAVGAVSTQWLRRVQHARERKVCSADDTGTAYRIGLSSESKGQAALNALELDQSETTPSWEYLCIICACHVHATSTKYKMKWMALDAFSG